MKDSSTTKLKVTALAFAFISLAACGSPKGDVHDDVVSDQQAIYQGTAAPNSYGAVIVNGTAGGCTGTIVNNSYVLTAAHCFLASSDRNSDRVITPAEANVTISGTSSAFTGTLNHVRTVRNSCANWGLSNGCDSALVQVAANSFNIGALSPDLYSGGVVKINSSSTANLSGHPEIFALGYGGVSSTDKAFGTLRYGWKSIPTGYAFSGWYWDSGGIGSSCKGDSGGPDWAWCTNTYCPGTPNGWQLVGVHSNGGDCDGSVSTMVGTSEIRTWILTCAGGGNC